MCALLAVPTQYALQYTVDDAHQTFTLTGITIGVGIFGGYAAIIAVYLAIAGFSPRKTGRRREARRGVGRASDRRRVCPCRPEGLRVSDDRPTRRDLMKPVQLLGLAFGAALFAGIVTLVSMGFFQTQTAQERQAAIVLALIIAGISFIAVLVIVALLLLAVDPGADHEDRRSRCAASTMKTTIRMPRHPATTKPC